MRPTLPLLITLLLASVGHLSAADRFVRAEGGDLIAIWAWHFPQHPKYSVSGLTYPSLLRRISEFNKKHAYGGPSQHPEDVRSQAEPIKS
jgi:hypothetical protein